jgi:hypothetical protein
MTATLEGLKKAERPFDPMMHSPHAHCGWHIRRYSWWSGKSSEPRDVNAECLGEIIFNQAGYGFFFAFS